MQFLERCGVDNLDRTGDEKQDDGSYDEGDQQAGPPAPHSMLVGASVIHPCAKKLEIWSAGIAPSRMTRQRAFSSLRSTMVEATSRGEFPPSTMMLMRP